MIIHSYFSNYITWSNKDVNLLPTILYTRRMHATHSLVRLNVFCFFFLLFKGQVHLTAVNLCFVVADTFWPL